MLVKKLIVTLCVIGLALAEQSPVFLWGVQSIAKPALQTVTQQEFADIIAPLVKDHMIVAFQEENLSTSDFLCSNENTLQSCYAQLQGVSPKTYYASVENPNDALRSLNIEREFNSIGKSGELQTPLECSPGKVVFVYFDSSSGERDQTLEAHDAVVTSITNEVSCPTVFLYMSTPSSASIAHRRARRATANTNVGYLFRDGADFLIYFSNLIHINGKERTELIISSMNVNNKNATSFSVSLNADTGKPLTFMITSASGYYTMSNIQYDNIKFYSLGIDSLTTFSYYCGNLTLQGIGTATEVSPHSLVWNSVQFQAPFGTTTNTTFIFGDPWHCVGFFTPAILMGLILIVLLLAITFTGICWMMDINTMDRFDDPKGKTITINAAE